jgi:hypothetical protein
MKYIIINVLEFIYILYMFVFFQTYYSIHHPLEYIINNHTASEFIKHPIFSGIYESKICPLGKTLAKLSFIFFTFRIIYYLYYNITDSIVSFYIINVVLIMSLMMNLNAFIYLIPIFMVEYYLLYY